MKRFIVISEESFDAMMAENKQLRFEADLLAKGYTELKKEFEDERYRHDRLQDYIRGLDEKYEKVKQDRDEWKRVALNLSRALAEQIALDVQKGERK